MPNLVGQSIGRYHIMEQLGEGGMATVFKAYDTRLERDVAIKVIRTGAFPAEQVEGVLKRFDREAKSLARLSHPNIVKVLDYGEYEGSPYLVLEYLPGGTLKQKLGRPLPWREAVKLLLPIGRALEFSHNQGIVHRDVKPANVLITVSGEPMLSDFGIAKLLENVEGQTLTGTGVGIGTPEYMAPEQWTGQAGPQADIYSLGIVFYELITGRKPYTADTPAAVLLKQANDPLPQPREYAKDLPAAVERIIFKALAKTPSDRYSSMSLFVQALESLITGSAPAPEIEGATRLVTPSGANDILAIPDIPGSNKKESAARPAKPSRPPARKRKLFLILAIVVGPILLCVVACSLMWGFSICPPQGPWPQPPWCPGSPFIWPFNDPIPLETPTGMPSIQPDADIIISAHPADSTIYMVSKPIRVIADMDGNGAIQLSRQI